MAKRKPNLVGTPEGAASAGETGGEKSAEKTVPQKTVPEKVTPATVAHYTDALPCDAALRRSVAKLLTAGVPMDRSAAQQVAESLPEAAVREVMRAELERDLSPLYERLTGKN
jgi:hypothetical protein